MKAPLVLALASLNDTRIKELGNRAEEMLPWRIHDIRRTVATFRGSCCLKESLEQRDLRIEPGVDRATEDINRLLTTIAGLS
jgi:hypothetical protein